MATPIERLNAGKTATVSNMCAQEKAQHVKYRYFTIPSFRFCCYTAGYLCFCGRLFMHCQLSRKPAKNSNMDRSLSLSSNITISLKVDLMMRLSSDAIGSWCRVGTGKMEGLARFPVTPKTDPCACLLLLPGNVAQPMNVD